MSNNYFDNDKNYVSSNHSSIVFEVNGFSQEQNANGGLEDTLPRGNTSLDVRKALEQATIEDGLNSKDASTIRSEVDRSRSALK